MIRFETIKTVKRPEYVTKASDSLVKALIASGALYVDNDGLHAAEAGEYYVDLGGALNE